MSGVNSWLRNSVNPMTPTRRSPSSRSSTPSTKSPSLLTSRTSSSRSASAARVRWIAMSTTFSRAAPASGTGR